ncbi:PHP domain-containing protein [Candidatus Fermentibacteria bacterium]|nr:PHP domain-containing protein [Candidatus Fermentibacteria bacterium]
MRTRELPWRADLHTHTTFSDGLLSPTALVERAAHCGLAAIAITDHDAVSGVQEALTSGAQLGIEVVPGVEISAGIDTQEIHVLGYWIDHTNAEFDSWLRRFQAIRVDRIGSILQRLDDIGIHIDYDYVIALGGPGAVGRPHIAKALVEYGFVGTEAEAFETLIGDGCPGYTARERVSPADAIRIINTAGGVAGWAHPAVEGHDEWLESLVDMGLEALEVVHPDHSRDDVQRYRRLAGRFGLIMTGGSDFHGNDKEGAQTLGRYTVDNAIVRQLEDSASSHREAPT